MSERSIECCAACEEVRICRLVEVEYEVQPSIHSYDPEQVRLVKSEAFFCYFCRGVEEEPLCYVGCTCESCWPE